MNRLTTVLYPSIPGSGSESASLAPTSSEGRQGSPQATTPSDPQFPLAMNSKSIYDDPRSSTFESHDSHYHDAPPSATYASVATVAVTTPAQVQVQGSGLGSHMHGSAAAAVAAALASSTTSTSASTSTSTSSRPSLLRKLTDEGIKASAAKRSGSPSPSRRRDRGLRINLMQAAATKGGKGRAPPPPSAGGRLSSVAKGPIPGRYVVGGGQYLRVLEIAHGHEDGRRTPDGHRTPPSSSPKSNRQAAAPFARGSGGTTIAEVVNFWKGSWAVGKGVNDVDWGTGNFENKIVTATPNGNFMIFDINRGKLERETSGGHPRPMNCIEFCKVQNSPYLLITGGTEGQVRLWDMRDSEPTSRKFYKHNAPVTALCFSPDEPHSFVVGTEAGGLFRYDYRVQNKAVGKVWGAHGSKPVMDLKWKPPTEDYSAAAPGKGWLASAGGDRTVQIWDMGQTWDKSAAPTHTLHTSHPARSVDWRPNHPTELVVVPFDSLGTAAPDPTRPEVIPDASDRSLEVWDVRRHYVAKYAISGLEGNAVGAIWDDSDTLIACYENGGLVQRDLTSKVTPKLYPLESIPRQLAAWSAKGELAYALDRFRLGEIPFDDVKPEFASWQTGGGRHRKGIADAAYEPQQAMGVVPLPDNDETEFIYIANHYRLEGDAPVKLCRWNREVAEMCGRPDEARIWDHLQGLIEEFGAVGEGMFNEAVFAQSTTPRATARAPSPRGVEQRPDVVSMPASPYGGIMGIPLEPDEEPIVEEDFPSGSHDSPSSEGSSDESDLGPSTPPKKSRFKSFMPPTHVHPSALRPSTGSHQNSLRTHSGRAKRLQMFETPVSEETPTPITVDMDYPDPYGIAAALEAVAPSGVMSKGGLTSRSTPHSTCPPTPALLDRKQLSSVNASPMGSQRPSIVGGLKDPRLQPAAITRRAQETFLADDWDQYRSSRCRVFLAWWKSYIDDGDVQLASALYVIGARVVKFPRTRAEQVVQAYIDLLERHRLDIPVAYLRLNAEILAIQTLPGQEGITHILHCANCGKSTGSLDDDPDKKKFWWCTKCRRGAKICTVCREPVRGLWMGCNKCRHGGHHRCMRLYYLSTEETVAEPSRAPSRASSPPPTARHSAGLGAMQGESLDSGFTDRTERDTDPNVGHEMLVSTNTCPSGCGCQCRAFGAYFPFATGG